jgi:hypothetical protein
MLLRPSTPPRLRSNGTTRHGSTGARPACATKFSEAASAELARFKGGRARITYFFDDGECETRDTGGGGTKIA